MLKKETNIILLWLIFAILGHPSVIAQTIRINEVSATNISFLDEDGDTPDWLELYNYGTETIDLTGWTITDNIVDTLKWTLPELGLDPDQYLLMWASKKDRHFIGFPRTLVEPFAEVRYIIPNSSPDANWTEPDYDDSIWETGETSIGYGDDDDSTQIAPGTPSVFLRMEFNLSEIESIIDLMLDIDYDDAFVAYLNGVEVARAAIDGYPPAYNQFASYDHEANLYRGIPLERFHVYNPQELLRVGKNVLSVQAHNVGSTSSDFSIIPILSALYMSTPSEGSIPVDFLNLRDHYLHTNFRISSAGETIYLFDANKVLVDSLAMPELSGEVTAGRTDNGSVTYLFDSPTPGYANSAEAFLGKVESTLNFSHDGGMVQPLSLAIAGIQPGEEIRYTTDGTVPTRDSDEYFGPLDITSTTILKAKVFRDGFLPSSTASRTYLIGANHQLPIVSLTFDHDDFFHADSGMYVLGEGYQGDIPYLGSNIWEEWERPVNFSYYDLNGNLGVSQDMGAKIFGGWSRSNPQRSLSLFARGGYGKNSLDYPLFEELDYSSFQAIVLRNSGNDWLSSQINDAFITSLMQGSGLEYQAFKSVATYLNGQYWGMYNIREKVNEHFLAAKAGVDPEDINLLEYDGEVIHGSNNEYRNLIDYIRVSPLSQQANYDYVKSKIDIDNFISYMVIQIYADNTDWPGNNIKFWNHKNGKWRWILFDTDFGFGIWDEYAYYHNTLNFALEENGPGWPNPPWSTLLMRKLVENEEFRNGLINRFADYMNSRFLPDLVEHRIDSISNIIRSEIAAHMDRWGGSYEWWEQSLNTRKKYARNRPAIMRSYISDYFNLDMVLNLNLENLQNESGLVKLNSLTIKDKFWAGKYFSNVPITIKAVPEEGYRFSHWSGSVNSTDAELVLELDMNTVLKAHFTPITGEPEPIVINEINYNSDKDLPTGDWVELYNPNPYSINLTDWQFKDSEDEHIYTLPELQDIDGYGYLVLCRDIAAFGAEYNKIENVVGNFEFGLSSAGDQVRIYDSNGQLQDEVVYSPLPPWPEAANGDGATLELIDPELDNSVAENWTNVNPFGSPGRANTVLTAIDDQEALRLSIFPNPTSNYVNIVSRNPGINARILLIDIKGTIITDEPFSGYTQLNLAEVDKGIYIIRIVDGLGRSESYRIVRQ